MSRADLLATRLHNEPCEHGRQISHWPENSLGSMCPGGVAVIAICGTCEGEGGKEHRHLIGVPAHDPRCQGECRYCPIEVPQEVPEFEPCPDCVGGLVAVKGQLIQWCETHKTQAFSDNPTKCWMHRLILSERGRVLEPCVFVVKWLGG